MSEQDESGNGSDQAEAPSAPVLDELGQAFERLYHAVARRGKAEAARQAADQEADAAKQEHQDAWNAVNDLQQGSVPVVPEQ